MEYTTRMGSGPKRAHVNYQCPCGCIGGVIYNAEKPLSKAGACCCGRKLWVGEGAEASLLPYLEPGVDYEWDRGSVTLPWGDTVPTAMAWPRSNESQPDGGHGQHALEDHDAEAAELVLDPVCRMTIRKADAVATSTHRGEEYFFCAAVCKQRFDAEPSRYVKSKGLLSRLRRQK